ncbi:MAG: hypothetical protein JNK30_02520 [Phenylobacterium sp.]|uniref:DUF4331 family protein n=1 Tax=Phenylobacterium sp. TaxID=1871053 RepID=UPI001A530B5A|nr:DUF4331 family protein [Phenylobacterium sp.]MBL8770231.1 hypothetical protein [Phenylobacterium sp.]
MSGLHRATGIVGLMAAAVLALSTSERRAVAADHLDPPTRTDPAFDTTADRAADIADVYVWHTADNLVIALTFAGPAPREQRPTYDRDVLYTINISNAGFPTDPEISIRFRFGQDSSGNSGIEISGLPDGGPPLVGPVETTLSRNGILARAGLYDDPFFFDLQGFRETRSTGNLQFVASRSFFSGTNDTSLVLQIPRSRVETGNELNIWATSARFGGQLQ